MSKLRICFVHEESPFSGSACAGIARYVETMSVQMARMGHQVYVLARNAEDRTLDIGVGQLTELRPELGIWEKRAVARARPDIVHELVDILTHSLAVRRRLQELESNGGLDVIAFADWRAEGLCVGPASVTAKRLVRLHAPTVMVAYANDWDWGFRLRLLNGLERHMCERVDLLTSPSAAMASFARERMPLRSLEPVVIPNPVDTEHFRPLPEVAQDPHVVLCVGRIEAFKGSDVLINAMPLVWRSIPQARVVFAGGTNDWNRGWAEDLKRQWQGDDRVAFLGLVGRESLPRLYNQARVLVVPSRFESFGYTCAEGMSCGLPVVASNAGSLPELIDHERDGLLFPACDAHSLAEHIVALLRDGVLGRTLGRHAREKMVTKFASPVVAKQMQAVYESLLEPSV